ncbi:MAG TPA: formate/nitrite transporter family protein [Usitatibacter sp.]|nr:formate/nitrite transporter family protein [Usitatibacter sp.]
MAPPHGGAHRQSRSEVSRDGRREERRQSKLEKEQQEVVERAAPRTPVIYEVVRTMGEEEMARPATSLWWSGLAGGLSISFSLFAQGVLQTHLPEAPWAVLVRDLGYPMGFLMVVLARQQLFTENTITMVLPVMAKPSLAALASMWRVWGIILAANLAGTLLAALFCTFTPVLEPDVREAMLAIAREAMDKAWAAMFFQAITAGFLMAAMVWLLPGAESAQFLVIVAMTYLIAISGAAHIVAGSIESFMLALHGELGAGRLVTGFLVPAFLGNVVGGTALFAVISYAQVMKEIEA